MQIFVTQMEGIAAKVVPLEQALGALTESSQRENRVRVKAALSNSMPTIKLVDYGPFGDWYRPLVAAGRSQLRPPFGPSGALDLAVALAYLGIEFDGQPYVVAVELALDGTCRGVRGIVPRVLAAKEAGFKKILVSAYDAKDARLVSGDDIEVLPCTTLSDVVRERFVDREVSTLPTYTRPTRADLPAHLQAKFDEAAAIVARGGHVLLVGDAGSGKTMVARRLPSIMAGEITQTQIAIRSAAGLPYDDRFPFRAPHHTVSTVAMIGGGSPVRPGEVTLAHGGILFLDELPEFSRGTLDATFRTVLDGRVRIGLRDAVTMPAAPIVVAAMSTCPCSKPRGVCTCQPERIERYRARVAPFIECLNMETVQLEQP